MEAVAIESGQENQFGRRHMKFEEVPQPAVTVVSYTCGGRSQLWHAGVNAQANPEEGL